MIVCPAKMMIKNRIIPERCGACCFEKQRQCDFPYIGKTNVFEIITEVQLREKAEREK